MTLCALFTFIWSFLNCWIFSKTLSIDFQTPCRSRSGMAWHRFSVAWWPRCTWPWTWSRVAEEKASSPLISRVWSRVWLAVREVGCVVPSIVRVLLLQWLQRLHRRRRWLGLLGIPLTPYHIWPPSQSRPVECQLSLTLILLLFTGATARHILKIRYNNADDGQGRKTDPIGNLHAALSSILPAISSF